MSTTLHGGPADGIVVDAVGLFIEVPEILASTTTVKSRDIFPWRPLFLRHKYHGRTGEYLGARMPFERIHFPELHLFPRLERIVGKVRSWRRR